ncbi:MAG TPA: iron ABC transporter permease [Polyangiaceae bacterium]|jgi:iron complex transport system permease protein|nr:iron ABC transporter permease [Polyangiaceae bacterium]
MIDAARIDTDGHVGDGAPAEGASPRGVPFGVVVAGLVVLALVAIGASLLVGRGNLSDPSLRSTLLALRSYRTATAFLAGACLATGGVMLQGLFRNPLADPSMIGATSGASFGGTAALVAFDFLLRGHAPRFFAPEMVLPAGCLLGALVPLALLLVITRWRSDRLVLLLAGFLLSSLFLSLLAFLISVAQESWELGRAVVRFSLGNVGGSGPRQIALIAPLAVAGILAAFFWARPLDVLLSGEQEAESLGVDTKQARTWCIAWTALLSAGAVAVGGSVAFVGLVVPHALRPLVGVGHRRLVPTAALGGGVFVVACDVLTRVVPGQGELPLGVITGVIGAPLFLFLLVKFRKEER